MALESPGFCTTFAYSPLQSGRHIRLLDFTSKTRDEFTEFSYSLVQYEVPMDAAYGDLSIALTLSAPQSSRSTFKTLNHWTYVDRIRFLNVVTGNGGKPDRPTEDILGPATQSNAQVFRNMSEWNESLGLALAMGRGRRFVPTEKGRLGLAPAVGIQSKLEGEEGLAVVVLHGCIMLVVLKPVGDKKKE
ncbi:hypothetical protein CC86DRAFT_401882 [Ophiobolus disseminans]|uniref:Uncharacterized protein n=1 Tax=Ophiobolus disseminans TaxID=1469910 RepID=A0A6A7AEN6_9PLEO|nr:hypothetical protein CC86DRAFT_401882 [Ophiobolus disseminans]